MGASEPVTGPGQPYLARPEYECCGTLEAVLIPTNGQNCVYCLECSRFLYNAPKYETGEAPRSVATLRKGLKPSQQVRIALRDNGCCIVCGSRDHLTMAHLISVADAVEFGVPGDVLESDFNKALMCEADNLGLNRLSVPAKFVVAWLLRLEAAHSDAVFPDIEPGP